MKAYEEFKKEEEYLYETAALLKMQNYNGFKEKLQALIDENNALRKEIAAQNEKAMKMEADAKVQSAEDINGLKVLILKLKDAENGTLKSYAETLRNKMQDGFVFVVNEANSKVTFVCASSKAAIAKGLKAGDLVKAAAQLTGGNGGGRPDMAQAGGRDASRIDEALAAVREKIVNA